MPLKRGNLFIISAPSGTGKTTILKKIIATVSGIAFSVSHTTRQPRSGEQEGVDYFFVDRTSFEAMRAKALFLEWAEVHGNLYGTSSKVIQELAEQGQDIILDIDVQGALQLQEKLGGEGVFVFIAPPSLQELEKRLAGRRTDSTNAVATRLANAQMELRSLENYDYVIVNEKVDQAIEVLRAVIIAERSRKRRGLSGEPLNLDF
jgi:guanylate kinase